MKRSPAVPLLDQLHNFKTLYLELQRCLNDMLGPSSHGTQLGFWGRNQVLLGSNVNNEL